ncbi:hypothetical protein [Streptomyces sp. cmx-18-6]|uniref:hypothetical protein n=1 Tax=Streptomyces sp. cmx-18-6 TaxID=2790930 RepID=UPI0039805EDA
MPLAHAVALLPSRRLQEVWRLVREPVADERELAEVRGALIDCGAATACEREAESLLRRAWEELESALPGSSRTRVLREMAWQTVRGDRIA